MTRKTLAAFALALGMAVPAAHAVPSDITGASATSGWTLDTFEQTVKKRGEPDFTYSGVVLYTAAEDQPGLMISCSEEKGLNATFTYQAKSFAELLADKTATTKARTVQGRIWIEDERDPLTRFVLRQKQKVAQLVGDDYAVDLLNAIMKGESVRLDIAGLTDTTYALPAGGDTVRDFIAQCPAVKTQ